ncbi:two-component system regulatory protein YycI [Bacillus alkalicellulosilyticus]|uniref:two-component system regulatory protein YycI n=1 Tax=Alkalihalobacterium alkalicellulosilyticum TaxID=1912214 RepID=UPI0009989A3C|nr:two-component system regulatory protein YycI [Bacillus alkalicellulosilyticus]
MDWSKTKTIFIITFLFLNTFLLIQLQEFNHANQISVITEATIQERLTEMNVLIDDEIEEEQLSGYHLVSREVEWTEENLSVLTNQQVDVLNNTTILSRLEQPYSINMEEELKPQLRAFLDMHVFQGEHYFYHGLNEDYAQVTFMRKYEEKRLYTSEDAPLILQLDEENQIVSYRQRIIEVDEQGREQEFLSGMKAVEILLNEQIIGVGQTITSIEFGYYSFFQPFGVGDVQVFAPMWKIRVEDDDFLVNAIEGSVQDIS